MTNVIRVALPGQANALVDTDPRDYSLFTDQDNVLIKEHSRGSVELDAFQSTNITHNIGYPPHFYVWAETSPAGRYQLVNGYSMYADWRVQVDSTKLYIENLQSNNDEGVQYYIFYDNIT